MVSPHFRGPSSSIFFRLHSSDVARLQASENDRFVALELLKNANIASGMVLPGCQDTGTAIIMGKRGQVTFDIFAAVVGVVGVVVVVGVVAVLVDDVVVVVVSKYEIPFVVVPVVVEAVIAVVSLTSCFHSGCRSCCRHRCF